MLRMFRIKYVSGHWCFYLAAKKDTAIAPDFAFRARLAVSTLEILIDLSRFPSIMPEKSASAGVGDRHSSTFQESINFPIATRDRYRGENATRR